MAKAGERSGSPWGCCSGAAGQKLIKLSEERVSLLLSTQDDTFFQFTSEMLKVAYAGTLVITWEAFPTYAANIHVAVIK